MEKKMCAFFNPNITASSSAPTTRERILHSETGNPDHELCFAPTVDEKIIKTAPCHHFDDRTPPAPPAAYRRVTILDIAQALREELARSKAALAPSTFTDNVTSSSSTAAPDISTTTTMTNQEIPPKQASKDVQTQFHRISAKTSVKVTDLLKEVQKTEKDYKEINEELSLLLREGRLLEAANFIAKTSQQCLAYSSHTMQNISTQFLLKNDFERALQIAKKIPDIKLRNYATQRISSSFSVYH
jgi:hypothetical protein